MSVPIYCISIDNQYEIEYMQPSVVVGRRNAEMLHNS